MAEKRRGDRLPCGEIGGMDRRTFVASAAMALAALGLPDGERVPGRGGAADGGLLSAAWSNPGGARSIGRDYLAQAPEEADPERLNALLFEEETSSSLAPDDLRARVQRLRTRDFEAGDTVFVRGWILSRTEARLCALAALA